MDDLNCVNGNDVVVPAPEAPEAPTAPAPEVAPEAPTAPAPEVAPVEVPMDSSEFVMMD